MVERFVLNRALSDAGFSLVTVLWILLAISAVLAPITMAARTQALYSASTVQIERLDLLAIGLSKVLMARVSGAGNAAPLLERDSTPLGCSTETLDISVSVQNHAGLVSLNQAPRPALAAAFSSLGFGDGEADALAAAAVAYRSRGRFAEATSITVQGGLKRASFESVSELFEFSGLQRTAYLKLHQTFSAHGTSNSLSLRFAPAHLADFNNRPGQSSIAQAEGSSPFVTISVLVNRNGILGQFNGIFDGRAAGTSHPIESWRYDDTSAMAKPESRRCEQLFGDAVADVLSKLEPHA